MVERLILYLDSTYMARESHKQRGEDFVWEISQLPLFLDKGPEA